MIKGIPKDVPYDTANRKLNRIIIKMFGENKVVNIKLVGQFNALFRLCEKLK